MWFARDERDYNGNAKFTARAHFAHFKEVRFKAYQHSWIVDFSHLLHVRTCTTALYERILRSASQYSRRALKHIPSLGQAERVSSSLTDYFDGGVSASINQLFVQRHLSTNQSANESMNQSMNQ
jgi:hypothetical protein